MRITFDMDEKFIVVVDTDEITVETLDVRKEGVVIKHSDGSVETFAGTLDMVVRDWMETIKKKRGRTS